jgi:AcrR family transcriptional regulator
MPTNKQIQNDKSTQERILAAARAEFARAGLEGARVDQIAEVAGVNKAMIYYHYSSKEKLYRAVFDFHIGQISAMLRERLAAPEDTEARLKAVAGFYAEMFMQMPDFKSLMMRELAQPSGEHLDPLADRLRESGVPDLLTETLMREVDSGGFRTVDIRQALVSFLALNIGYFFLEPLAMRTLGIEDRETFVKERVPAIVDLFLNGMKARSS